MGTLKRRPFGVLLGYDLRVSLTSPRGLLFLVFFAMIWGWIISKLAGGGAEQLRGSEAGTVMSFIFDPSWVRLLTNQPATLAAYFILALMLTPLFAILGACDQTAGDLATKHLRFLIPRVGRNEIYFARFLGSAILVGAAQLLAVAVATVVQLKIGGSDASQVLGFGAQAALVLVLYSVAYVALMSLVCATVASIGLSLLSAIGLVFVVVALVAALSSQVPAAAYLAYLLPSGLKPQLMSPDFAGALTGLAGVLAYVAVYLYGGLRVFRVRDA